MGLLSPWWLAGLLAIGLPIYLHLLQQHRLDVVKFPSLQFFEKRTQSSVRQRRLKYLLLFALRVLMLLLLALLFAQPFLRRDAASMTSNRHVVFLIDNSFSMRASNALDEAKKQAGEAIGSLRAGDTAQVASLSSGVAILNQPTQDKAELRSAIQSIAPGDGRSSLAEVARTAKSLAANLKVPVEIRLYSDFQRTSMPAQFSELALPAGVTMIPVPLASSARANFAVENVNAPSIVADPKKTRLVATIAGHGTPAASKSVSLVVNGKTVATKTANIPALGRAAVEFIGVDASYGWNRGEIKINGGDSLAADDTYRFAFERADPRPALFVHEPGRTRAALYFRAALESGAASLFALDAMPADQVANVAPSRYAFVVLGDVGSLPANFENELKKYVASGGGVWVLAGASTASRGTVPLTGAKVTESRYASRNGERFFTAAPIDLAHPSIERADRWEGVRFYQAIATTGDNARQIARLSDGTSLLTDAKVGDGRVLFFASPLDNVANDFPLHASFVPFVERTGRYLAQIDSRPATVAVDSFVELRSAGSKAGTAVDVIDPNGDRALDLKSAASAQNVRVTSEGYWEIARQNGRRELIAVNADRAESNLETLPAETLDIWKKTGEETALAQGGQAEADKTRQSLWWYLALALLIATLAQTFVASRYLDPETA